MGVRCRVVSSGVQREIPCSEGGKKTAPWPVRPCSACDAHTLCTSRRHLFTPSVVTGEIDAWRRHPRGPPGEGQDARRNPAAVATELLSANATTGTVCEVNALRPWWGPSNALGNRLPQLIIEACDLGRIQCQKAALKAAHQPSLTFECAANPLADSSSSKACCSAGRSPRCILARIARPLAYGVRLDGATCRACLLFLSV